MTRFAPLLCALALALARPCAAAEIASEEDLRAAILQGTGSHSLKEDLVLSRDLPPLPDGARFALDGRNHRLSGARRHSLFRGPGGGTVLILENITLAEGYTAGHGAAISLGNGGVVERDIPGFGKVPILIEGSRDNRLVLRNSILQDHVSAKSGGAIFLHLEGEPGEPYALIENTALIGNSVLPGPTIPTFQVNGEHNNGGAIWIRVQAYKSDVVIRNSTLSGNSAPELGGAILVGESAGPPDQAMTVKLLHSTVVGNRAGLAGGAFWHDHSLLLDHSIVWNNAVGGSAAADGSDIAGPGPDLTIRWTLLGNRRDEHGRPIDQRSQRPVRGFASKWEDNNRSGDPLLSPFPVYLASRAGTAYSTYVHRIDRTSPAFDAGDPALAAGTGTTPSWDQRGNPKPRIGAGRIDLGAFEFDSTAADAPPRLAAIDTLRILEDSPGRLVLTVSDAESPAESLLLALAGAAPGRFAVEAEPDSGGTRVFRILPAPDYHTGLDGPRALTATVQDGSGSSASRSVALVIDPVNDPPLLRGPADTVEVRAGFTARFDFGLESRTDRGDATTADLEKDQSVAFEFLSVDKPGRFRHLALDPSDGALSVTVDPSLVGRDTAQVFFRIRDDGGRADGGRDSSQAYPIILILIGNPPPEPPFLEAKVSPLVEAPGPEAPRRGFQTDLLTVTANMPFRYALKVFTTRGEFVDRIEGDVPEAVLGTLPKDPEGRRAFRLTWKPNSRQGNPLATGSYVVLGKVATDGPEPRAAKVEAVFGYLRSR